MVGAVCLLLSSTVYAEDLKSTDANIVGHVIEKSTREHLPYMTVSLKGTTIGTMTDATGHYFLKNLPEGEFTLSVSAVGYKSQERKVVLKRGKGRMMASPLSRFPSMASPSSLRLPASMRPAGPIMCPTTTARIP